MPADDVASVWKGYAPPLVLYCAEGGGTMVAAPVMLPRAVAESPIRASRAEESLAPSSAEVASKSLPEADEIDIFRELLTECRKFDVFGCTNGEAGGNIAEVSGRLCRMGS